MKTKKIVITGGATRIGAAIAKSLADEQWESPSRAGGALSAD